MNIIEAIKSGKRFKRQHWEVFLYSQGDYNFPSSDILADDWEVEDQAVMVTREQLEAAWREVIGWNEPNGASTFEAISKELGL